MQESELASADRTLNHDPAGLQAGRGQPSHAGGGHALFSTSGDTNPKPQAVALRPYKSQEPTAVCCPEERLKRREEKLSAEQEE